MNTATPIRYTRTIPSKKAQFGQGMTEYIIIVALIAVSAIGVYRLFGDTIRQQVAGLALEMSGYSAADVNLKARDSAQAAEKQANARKDLANYHDGNRK